MANNKIVKATVSIGSRLRADRNWNAFSKQLLDPAYRVSIGSRLRADRNKKVGATNIKVRHVFQSALA